MEAKIGVGLFWLVNEKFFERKKLDSETPRKAL